MQPRGGSIEAPPCVPGRRLGPLYPGIPQGMVLRKSKPVRFVCRRRGRPDIAEGSRKSTALSRGRRSRNSTYMQGVGHVGFGMGQQIGLCLWMDATFSRWLLPGEGARNETPNWNAPTARFQNIALAFAEAVAARRRSTWRAIARAWSSRKEGKDRTGKGSERGLGRSVTERTQAMLHAGRNGGWSVPQDEAAEFNSKEFTRCPGNFRRPPGAQAVVFCGLQFGRLTFWPTR